ncbi:hypothetical protein [Polymorphospora rubra]|uniref:Uncharacterized protein n=1 Tax=Polymorphospora rubra TaxID=338584 RepID=A0A810N2I4_9ACTN|nr:hypothetical protein [Polymorphospora rubra]BCJ67557.1 hypothetical protein Prubr_45780 [Polymorphospora rubra]
MPLRAVTGHLLVRQLGHWLPDALHRSRRATLVQAYGGDPGDTPEAALRACTQAADRLRGRQLTVVVVAGNAVDVAGRLDAPAPGAGVAVHGVPGGPDHVPVALKAAAAAGAPVLTYLDASTGPAPGPATLAAVAGGRPGELLLVLGPAARAGFDHRAAPASVGFPLVTAVELVEPATDGRWLVVFATRLGRALDAFKEALWAADGVRLRDPDDPDAEAVDVTSRPDLGPLRRALVAHLGSVRRASVADLRRFTATATIHRSADTDRVLAELLAEGAVDREPRAGRLAGDVVIRPSAS